MNNVSGSGRPRNVPKASRKMRSASSSSLSLRGRMVVLVFTCSIIGFLLPPALFGRVLSRPALESLDSLSNAAYPRSVGFFGVLWRGACEIINLYEGDVREEA